MKDGKKLDEKLLIIQINLSKIISVICLKLN